MYHSSWIVFLAAPLAVFSSPLIAERQTVGSIHDAFVKKGKLYVGVATDQNRFSVSQNADIIKNYFGQVTPENSMKWDSIECKFTYAIRYSMLWLTYMA